jgi:Bbp16
MKRTFLGIPLLTALAFLLLAVIVVMFPHAGFAAIPMLGAGMIMDARNEFCDATALNTGSAASYAIGSVIDLGTVPRDIGNGQPLYLVISVDTSVDSSGDGTKQQFHLVSDATTTIAVDGSATYHLSTPVFTQAQLLSGARFIFPIPVGIMSERYLAFLHTTSVEAATAGKVNAFLTMDPAGNRAYPDAL